MITDSQKTKIFKEIEKELGQKIIKNLILSSRYGLKRLSDRRVFLIETKKEKYILEVTKGNLNLENSEIFNDKLKEYYPDTIFYKSIKVGEIFNIVISKYIQGEKISSILNSNRKSSEEKEKLINSIHLYILQKNKILGKKSNKKLMNAEIKRVIDVFADKFLIDPKMAGKIKSMCDKLTDEIPANLIMKRNVNFDFIPENILLNRQNRIQVIDLEYVLDSHLFFLEAVRFVYYLAYDKYLSIKETNPNIGNFYLEYSIINLLSTNSEFFGFLDSILSKLGFKLRSNHKMILLFFIVENLLQEEVHHNVVDQKTIASVEKVLNYLLSNDPALKLVDGFTESLKNELSNRMPQDQLEKQSLEQILNQITSSKFFKLWQFYCKYRDLLKEKILQ